MLVTNSNCPLGYCKSSSSENKIRLRVKLLPQLEAAFIPGRAPFRTGETRRGGAAGHGLSVPWVTFCNGDPGGFVQRQQLAALRYRLGSADFTLWDGL